MTDEEVYKRIKAIRLLIESLTEEVQYVQAQCSHAKYVEGLTMMGCIQRVLLCENCGYAKPPF